MSASTETIAFLANYNSWRRGDETLEMPSPAEIGATIDDAVNLLRKYDDLKARAERAEAELAGIRALANRRNKRDHSQATTHQLVAALDQALDIAQAELVEQKWLKESALKRAKELTEELAAERARLDWLLPKMGGNVLPANGCVAWTVDVYHYGNRFPSRAAIDAAMKEDGK